MTHQEPPPPPPPDPPVRRPVRKARQRREAVPPPPRPAFVPVAAAFNFLSAAGFGWAAVQSAFFAVQIEGVGGGMPLVFGMLLLSFGMIQAWVGLGLLMGKGWSRTVAMVFAGLSAALTLIGGKEAGLTPVDWARIAANGLILVCLLHPAVGAWFTAMADPRRARLARRR